LFWVTIDDDAGAVGPHAVSATVLLHAQLQIEEKSQSGRSGEQKRTTRSGLEGRGYRQPERVVASSEGRNVVEKRMTLEGFEVKIGRC